MSIKKVLWRDGDEEHLWETVAALFPGPKQSRLGYCRGYFCVIIEEYGVDIFKNKRSRDEGS